MNNPCGVGLFAEVRLAGQDFEGHELVEPRLCFLFRLPHDEGLERSEVMLQPSHPVADSALQQDFASQEINRHGQLGRAENLFLDRRENLLRRNALAQPLGEDAEEVRLLDVFLAVQKGSRHVSLCSVRPEFRKAAIVTPDGDIETTDLWEEPVPSMALSPSQVLPSAVKT